MKKVYSQGDEELFYQLESDEEIFLDKKRRMMINTRLPSEYEDFEDFKPSEILDIKITDERSEWFVIAYKETIEGFLDRTKAITDELRKIK